MGNLSTIQIDPFGEYVALVMNNQVTEKETNVAEFITTEGDVKLNTARSKVSNSEPMQRLAIISLKSDTLKWICLWIIKNITRIFMIIMCPICYRTQSSTTSKFSWTGQ